MIFEQISCAGYIFTNSEADTPGKTIYYTFICYKFELCKVRFHSDMNFVVNNKLDIKTF